MKTKSACLLSFKKKKQRKSGKKKKEKERCVTDERRNRPEQRDPEIEDVPKSISKPLETRRAGGQKLE